MATVQRLLEPPFQGRDELLAQLTGARVQTIDEYGSLSFEVSAPFRAEVRNRVPVYAQAEDADGMTIEVLLHVVEGKLNEL
jgi:hypothetical protein